LEEIGQEAKFALRLLNSTEKVLTNEVRVIIKQLLEDAQTKLPEGKELVLREIEVGGKKTAWILMKDEVVYREIENRTIISKVTIEDFLNTEWFSLGLAKSILSKLIHYELCLVDQ